VYWVYRGNLGSSELINEFERVALDLPIFGHSSEFVDDDTNAEVGLKPVIEVHPIIVRPVRDDFAQSLKKVFLKELPNHDYDISSPEAIANLSLQSGEIFEYFLSASKHSSVSVEKMRERFADMNLDVTGLSDEDLKKRMDFVDGFLFHIF